MEKENEQKGSYFLETSGPDLSVGEVASPPPPRCPFSGLFCRLLPKGASSDNPVTHKILETIIGAVYGKRQEENLRGDTLELGFIRSQVISLCLKFW